MSDYEPYFSSDEADSEPNAERRDRLREERRHAYDDNATCLATGSWQLLVDDLSKALLPRTQGAGWAWVRVVAQALDGRDFADELPVDLQRPDLPDAIARRLDLLLQGVPTPFRGVLHGVLHRSDRPIGAFEVAAHVGAQAPWTQQDSEALVGMLGRENRRLRRELDRERKHSGRMFGNAAGVIGATAEVIRASVGLEPPAPAGHPPRPSNLEAMFAFGSNLVQQYVEYRARTPTTPPSPAPPQTFQSDAEDGLDFDDEDDNDENDNDEDDMDDGSDEWEADEKEDDSAECPPGEDEGPDDEGEHDHAAGFGSDIDIDTPVEGDGDPDAFDDPSDSGEPLTEADEPLEDCGFDAWALCGLPPLRPTSRGVTGR